MWTYDPSQLSTTPIFQVRFLVGDTIANSQQISDEEIGFSLTLRSSIWGAAATCLRNLAAQLSREADSVQKELRILYSSRAKAYAARAAELEALSVGRGGFAGYAGGISIFDKDNQLQNSDRVPPEFQRDFTDNQNNPLAPAGNQNDTDASSGQGSLGF